jgi:hypothetical protein
MVDIIKPKEEWTIEIILEGNSRDCSYLVFPINYHGCSFMHESEFLEYPRCTKETCPLRKAE